ncbi:hypothetical protein JCM10207_004188 [Rhodosporidiobolus poonsookiae]
MSAPAFLIPAVPHDSLASSSLAWAVPAARASAYAVKSSVTARDIAQYNASHDQPLRPPAGPTSLDKASLTSYKPPQHPASHVLHSIPPRAPSRSSRSNILSYTLHLATSSRLAAYNAPAGSRSLLYFAESDQLTHASSADSVTIDDAWFDAEQKTQGLWKVGSTLLSSSRSSAASKAGETLPPSVERRVALASLTESLLVSPPPDRALLPIDSDSTQSAAEVDELRRLRPLTAPDSTTVYHSTSAHTPADGLGGEVGGSGLRRPRGVQSVAQSLIDLKFGAAADEPAERLSPSLMDNKPLAALAAPVTSASTGAATEPHMDYRIVLSASMRTRARSIFATSPLPALTSAQAYCRAHRVSGCGVCQVMITQQQERQGNHAVMRRKNMPGAGLGGPGLTFVPASPTSAAYPLASSETAVEGKRPLVDLIPDFLHLSAGLLKDIKDRANRPLSSLVGGAEESLLAEPSAKGKERADAEHEFQVTAAWYDLLTALLTQACLEGYLVDGWTGTDGIETLFGLGCGVWEGRGWSAALPPQPSVPANRRSSTSSQSSAGSDMDSDEEEDEAKDEQDRQRCRETEARGLVETARALFGTRDVAQADYERGMRDRSHEFLNVPASLSLHDHLHALSVKYPLSRFEDAMVDFIEASVRLLGRPALAKYDPSASSASPHAGSPAPSHFHSNDNNPDPYALVAYFAPASFATVGPIASPRLGRPLGVDEERKPHRAWEDDGMGDRKRRRVD